MAYFQSFWLRLLLISLLCVSANAITINNNLTGEWKDGEGVCVAAPYRSMLVIRAWFMAPSLEVG